MAFSRTVKDIARTCGIDISRSRPENSVDARRAKYLDDNAVDLVLDVGANTGGYARHLRESGFTGRIESFEPLTSAFELLESASKNDPLWNCHKSALGNTTGQASINIIAANSASSSLLEMADRHVSAAPDSAYVGSETIDVGRIDDIFAGLAGDAEAVLLKIDTQGFEHQVLQGAERTPGRIVLLEIELSFTELYEKQKLAEELLAFLRDRHFSLISLERGFTDPDNFHMLQCDAILLNTALAGQARRKRP